MAWDYKDSLRLAGLIVDDGLTTDHLTLDAGVNIEKIFAEYKRNVENVIAKAQNAKSRRDLDAAENQFSKLSAKFENDYYRVMAAVSDYKREYDKVYDRAEDALASIGIQKGII